MRWSWTVQVPDRAPEHRRGTFAGPRRRRFAAGDGQQGPQVQASGGLLGRQQPQGAGVGHQHARVERVEPGNQLSAGALDRERPVRLGPERVPAAFGLDSARSGVVASRRDDGG